MQDCSDVMQLLLKTQTDMKDLADDDPQVSLYVHYSNMQCLFPLFFGKRPLALIGKNYLTFWPK
jgi:hypothetical protein